MSSASARRAAVSAMADASSGTRPPPCCVVAVFAVVVVVADMMLGADSFSVDAVAVGGAEVSEDDGDAGVAATADTVGPDGGVPGVTVDVDVLETAAVRTGSLCCADADVPSNCGCCCCCCVPNSAADTTSDPAWDTDAGVFCAATVGSTGTGPTHTSNTPHRSSRMTTAAPPESWTVMADGLGGGGAGGRSYGSLGLLPPP